MAGLCLPEGPQREIVPSLYPFGIKDLLMGLKLPRARFQHTRNRNKIARISGVDAKVTAGFPGAFAERRWRGAAVARGRRLGRMQRACIHERGNAGHRPGPRLKQGSR